MLFCCHYTVQISIIPTKHLHVNNVIVRHVSVLIMQCLLIFIWQQSVQTCSIVEVWRGYYRSEPHCRRDCESQYNGRMVWIHTTWVHTPRTSCPQFYFQLVPLHYIVSVYMYSFQAFGSSLCFSCNSCSLTVCMLQTPNVTDMWL